MASKGDVKAVQITAAGSVFGGRTRLRGLILTNTTTTTDTGSIVLQDENATQFQTDVLPGDVLTLNLPEDGILFKGHMTCNSITSAKATVLIDK